jgi:hypothetical protein
VLGHLNCGFQKVFSGYPIILTVGLLLIREWRLCKILKLVRGFK